MVTSPSRRSAIVSIGAVFGTALAGCIGEPSEGSTEIEDSRVIWQTELDHSGGNVAIDEDKVYVSSGFTTYALSRDSGEQEWIVAEDDPDIREGSCFENQLTIDNERIYLPGCQGVTALSKFDGTEHWRTGSEIERKVTVSNGTVYASSETLVALDAETGDIKWEADDRLKTPSPPVANSDTVVVADRAEDIVYAYDTSGTARWTYDEIKGESKLTIAPDVLYLSDGVTKYPESRDTMKSFGQLLALSLDHGERQWQVETELPTRRRTTRPTVGADEVYISSAADPDGHFTAYKRENGDELWSFTADGRRFNQSVFENGVCYVGSSDNHIYAFSPDGTLLWSLDAQHPVWWLTASDEAVYAVGQKQVFAVEIT